MNERTLRALMGLSLALVAASATPGRAGDSPSEPLHRRIDRAIEEKAGGIVAAPATDAEFVRRLTLDLNGRIPSLDEARAFIDDPSPYKRERQIDLLLARPEFARRMQVVFDLMLMERRADVHVPAPAWREYLRTSFAQNKPYDQLVREILSADGTDPASRPAAKFVLDREAEPNLLARDLGRMFLGRDLQCAQCHDHPLIDDYKQAHYYGLFAFVGRSSVFTDPKLGAVLAEKADGDVTFSSVFKKKVKHTTGPRVLDYPPVEEPALPKGQEYLVAPADKVRPVPAYSRRAQLAGKMTDPAVVEFRRNIANRLWALMMGRGLVHPLDMHHGDNPPSHPELLDDLADAFAAMNYDVKAFLRELALTRTYQRSSEPAPGMTEEQTDPALFAVYPLKPLSPEQLGWSLLEGLGYLPLARAEAERTLEGVDPKMKAILQLDDRRRRLREELLEQAVHDRYAASITPFIRQFGAAAGQPQDAAQATVHQALFLTNGEPVQGWTAPQGENLTGRLSRQEDPAAIAEGLYLALLSRRPTAEERQEVADYLAARASEKPKAVQELAWALVASTEFRFNH